MAFEDKEYKKDANFLFKLERHIKQYMLFWIIIESALIALLVLTIMAMLPLKQNVPYLVFFSNAETNFIPATPGNLDIRSEEALLKPSWQAMCRKERLSIALMMKPALKMSGIRTSIRFRILLEKSLSRITPSIKTKISIGKSISST